MRKGTIAKKTHKWWTAQCAFRGLKVTGTVAELQETLGKDRHLRMASELRNELHKMKLKFEERCREEFEDKWAEAGDDLDQKVTLWPRRALIEELFSGGKRALVVKTNVDNSFFISKLKKAAEALQVVYEVHDKYQVVGRTDDDVLQAVKNLGEEMQQDDDRRLASKAAEFTKMQEKALTEFKQAQEKERAEGRQRREERMEKCELRIKGRKTPDKKAA